MPAAKVKNGTGALHELEQRIQKLERSNRSLTRLVRKLAVSTDGTTASLLSADLEAELDRRIDDFETGRSPGIPWSKVRERLFKKYGVQ